MGGSSSSTTERTIPPEQWWEEYVRYILTDDALQSQYRKKFYQGQADDIMGYGNSSLSDQLKDYTSGIKGSTGDSSLGKWWQQYGLTSNPLDDYLDVSRYLPKTTSSTTTPTTTPTPHHGDHGGGSRESNILDSVNRANMQSIKGSDWDPLGSAMQDFANSYGAKLDALLGGSVPLSTGFTDLDAERLASNGLWGRTDILAPAIASGLSRWGTGGGSSESSRSSRGGSRTGGWTGNYTDRGTQGSTGKDGSRDSGNSAGRGTGGNGAHGSGGGRAEGSSEGSDNEGHSDEKNH